jgi:hypothetical protein
MIIWLAVPAARRGFPCVGPQRLDRLPLLISLLMPAHYDPRAKQVVLTRFEDRP